MKKKARSGLRTPNLDFWGIASSLFCAIHCTLLPVVLTLGAFAGVSWISYPWVEWLLFSITLILGGYSLGTSYFFRHKHSLPLFIYILGLLIFICGKFNTGVLEALPAAIGGITIAIAHYYNWKLLHYCN